MEFIIELLASAGVLLLMSKYLNHIHVRDFSSAILVALVIALLNATIGWVLRGMGNLFTLGLLSWVIQFLVLTLMVKMTSSIFRRFEVDHWWAAAVVAAGLTITAYIIEYIF